MENHGVIIEINDGDNKRVSQCACIALIGSRLSDSCARFIRPMERVEAKGALQPRGTPLVGCEWGSFVYKTQPLCFKYQFKFSWCSVIKIHPTTMYAYILKFFALLALAAVAFSAEHAHHGHGHGHATSYQNFQLHSYHPVPVYYKKHHEHH